MVVKTFRGLLEDGGQDHIRLQTIKGKVGYKIIKFELMGKTPGASTQESVVQIFKEFQSTIDATVEFTESALLAAAFWAKGESVIYPLTQSVIFDNEIFNQDIYVTHKDTETGEECNYYLELEVIPLTDSDAEFTTLKDIRGRNTTP